MRGTVLYIEDNPSNLALVEGIVAKRLGVTLVTAVEGTLGLELAAARRPDLVLLDLHLPDMPGEEVMRRLRAEPATERTPVVVLSADATPGQVERMLTAGASDYLTKPFDIRHVLAWIDRALGGEPGADAGAVSGAVSGADAGGAAGGNPSATARRALPTPRLPTGPTAKPGPRHRALPSTAILDPGQLASLRELDDTGEALRRVGELFVEDARVKAVALAHAVAEGNVEAVARVAHSMKGSAGIVGATALAAAASAIEVVARSGGLPSETALTLFRRDVDAAVAAVGAMLTGPADSGAGASADDAPPSSISAVSEDRAGAIEDLLRATEAAHAVHERDELAGVYDEAWPAWYAAYAVDHGLGGILGRDVAAEELAEFLTRTWDAATQSGSKPAEPWSTWMARRIATEL